MIKYSGNFILARISSSSALLEGKIPILAIRKLTSYVAVRNGRLDFRLFDSFWKVLSPRGVFEHLSRVSKWAFEPRKLCPLKADLKKVQKGLQNPFVRKMQMLHTVLYIWGKSAQVSTRSWRSLSGSAQITVSDLSPSFTKPTTFQEATAFDSRSIFSLRKLSTTKSGAAVTRILVVREGRDKSNTYCPDDYG